MTNKEWLIERIKNSDKFLAELIIVDEPTCADDYGWQDMYTNAFNRRYKTVESNCYRNILGVPQECEVEVHYISYNKCEEDTLAWLNEEHIEEETSDDTL